MPLLAPRKSTFGSPAPFYLALGLLAALTAVTWAGVWGLYAALRETREEELDRRLIAIARAAEPAVAQRAEFAMLALREDAPDTTGDRAWQDWLETLALYAPEWEALRRQLDELRRDAGLHSLQLLAPQGRVLLDPARPELEGRAARHIQSDPAWQTALDGEAATLPFYHYQDIPYKRIYVPMRLRAPAELQGETGAVLRLEARFDAFREIARLRSQIIAAGLAMTLVIGLVALLFHRLIRMLVRLRENAAHRDRLQAMGALAAGIAHEIRNPLGIIRGMAEALRGDLAPEDPGREMLDDIVGEVERLGRLTTQYVQFARPGTAEAGEPARLETLLPEVVKLVEKSGEGPGIDYQAPEAAPPRPAMPEAALRQVLINLLLNAREATPPGGPPVRLHWTPTRGGGVEIEVRDQGEGIPPRTLRRVFEPFFTTRPRGSGLGLAISRHLVEDCGGRLTLESRPHQGTRARILLPPAQGR